MSYLGNTLTGASLGLYYGPSGAAIGGIIGAGFGLYNQGNSTENYARMAQNVKDLSKDISVHIPYNLLEGGTILVTSYTLGLGYDYFYPSKSHQDPGSSSTLLIGVLLSGKNLAIGIASSIVSLTLYTGGMGLSFASEHPCIVESLAGGTMVNFLTNPDIAFATTILLATSCALGYDDYY